MHIVVYRCCFLPTVRVSINLKLAGHGCRGQLAESNDQAGTENDNQPAKKPFELPSNVRIGSSHTTEPNKTEPKRPLNGSAVITKDSCLCNEFLTPCSNTHPFSGPLPETTQVNQYQKGKTDLDFT